jgi:hypothetical protein
MLLQPRFKFKYFEACQSLKSFFQFSTNGLLEMFLKLFELVLFLNDTENQKTFYDFNSLLAAL